MSAPRAAVAVATLALTAAAPAGAAASWTLTELAPPAAPLSLAADGRLLAAWQACDATACSTVTATRAPGGPLVRAQSLPGELRAATPLRAGGALLLTSPLSFRGLTASDVTAGGRVLRSARLERRHARDPVAASNRLGTSAVAWTTSVAPWELRVRVRRGAGAFGSVRVIARAGHPGGIGGAALAVGPRGEVAVLWAASGALRARVLRPGAHGLGPVLRAGPSDRVARIAGAYSAGGTLAAIWSSADGGEEQNRTAIVRTAALPAGAARFARHVRLGEGADRETFVFGGGTAVRAAAAGRTANVAWTSRSLRVRLGTVHADGSLTAVRSLDAPGVLVDAAGSWTGRALFAWTHDPFGAGSVARAVPRVNAQRLGPTEDAGPAGSRATAALLADGARRALVGWSAGDPVAPAPSGIAERGLP